MSDIEIALTKLRTILPLEVAQLQLSEPLRRAHRSILCYFLESGRAPRAGEAQRDLDWFETLQQLETSGLIVLDSDSIVAAYPFSAVDRGFHVISTHGQVQAICAFDALAISPMFKLPTRIDASCRISGKAISILQDGDTLKTRQMVLGAIDWSAADNSRSCATSLCSEMIFIEGEKQAFDWLAENPEQRMLFSLQEAQRMISDFFMPLVTQK